LVFGIKIKNSVCGAYAIFSIREGIDRGTNHSEHDFRYNFISIT
jgi:hypothetical protein